MRVLTSMYIAIPRPSLRFEGQLVSPPFIHPPISPTLYGSGRPQPWWYSLRTEKLRWKCEVTRSRGCFSSLSFSSCLPLLFVLLFLGSSGSVSRVVLAGSPRWIIHGALQESPSHQRHLIRRGQRGRGPVEVLGVVGVLWVSGSVSFSTTDLMTVLLYSKRTWKGGGQCMTKWSLISTRDSDKLLLANKRNEKRKKRKWKEEISIRRLAIYYCGPFYVDDTCKKYSLGILHTTNRLTLFNSKRQ